MRRLLVVSLVVIFLTVTASFSAAVDKQIVAGAGPSTVVVTKFFQQFGQLPVAEGYEFIIPERSAKHAGGIKCSNENLFGRTGRPLNASELELNKGEIYLAKVPIAFAIGEKVGISDLSLEQLKAIYTGKITNWQEVGGQDAEIVIAGREKTEALFSVLKQELPFFEDAKFDKVLKKDHQVVNFLTSPQGEYAIGFGAKPNFSTLKVLDVDGFSSGVNVGLVYDESVKEHQIVTAVKQYAASSNWKESVSSVGLLAVGN